MSTTSGSWASEPIAIVGMSCKFAGDATNPERLWKMLAEGRSAWTEIPSSRFNLEGSYHPNSEKLSTTSVRGGHFIEEDLGLFDAAFFNYSAETASTLDPQFRLQLESVYEALENAGLPLAQVAGSNTSVFAGIFFHDYKDGITRDEDNLYRFFATGTGSAMASNRISHFYDFRGASMTIDTGCSTTLVALHQAVQSLRTGEADMSIVNGANVLLNADMFKTMNSLGFLSPDGKSFAFDSRANGYGRGEGVAAVVLKRLKDAVAAGDPIRGVIRESLLNQDGKTETITAPSQAAQEMLMRDCYRKAGLDPLDTQYFEAHGTGTQTGDPIEARAIAAIFQPERPPNEPLLIGSVKTNVGHTETTSGLASIIKTVLAIEKGMIPPSINFEKPNPKLALEDWRLKVATELQQWPATPNGIRRASINNFGYGGSNSHVILDGWPPSDTINNGTNGHTTSTNGTNGHSTSDHNTKLLILSARDENACLTMVSNLKEYLEQRRKIDAASFLECLAYTLGERRTLFPWVAVHPVSYTQGIDEVIQALKSPKFKPSRTTRQPRVGMVFTGQGAQWHAMGRELIDTYPTFKASLEEADGYLKELGADWSLIEELSRDAETTRVNETGLSIPICVALQISLVRLLRTWGVVPNAVTSHSSGEISAAYTAGAIGYRIAMAIAHYRSVMAADKSLRGVVEGGMVAIGLGQEDTERYLERLTCGGKAVIACVNSPSSTTVAGDLSAVQEIQAMAKADGVFARRLKVDTGYHSHHMHPIAGPYLKALRNTTSEETSNDLLDSIAFSSPVTGGRIISVDEIADPEHWVGSLIKPVQFIDAFTDMVLGDIDPSGSSVDVIIEVGPHTALGGPIRQILELPEFNGLQLPYLGCLVRNTNAQDSMQALAASLIREGYPLNMEAINFPSGRPSHVRVLSDLPSYPWNHQKRHWAESRLNRAIRDRSQQPHDLLGSPVPAVNIDTPTWRQIVRVAEIPWIRDHVVQSNILYPGAGYICLAIEAVTQVANMEAAAPNSKQISGYRLRDIDILQGLVVPDNADGIEVQTILRPVSDKAIGIRGWKHFEVCSVTPDNRWTQHAKGVINVEFEESTEGLSTGLDGKRNNAIAGYTRLINPADLFANLQSVGINHGPMFQNIKSIVQSGKERRSVATIVIADTSIPNDLPRSHVLHPTTLDSIVTAAYSALPGVGAHEESAKVPRSIEKLWISSRISNEAGHSFKSYSTISHADSNSVQADVSLTDGDNGDISGDGLPILEIQGLTYQSLGRSALREQSKPWEKEVCSKIEWALDISLASPAAFDLIKKQLSHGVDPVEDNTIIDLRRVCLYYIEGALAVLSNSDMAQLEIHHAKYYKWMQDQVKQASAGLLGPGSAYWTLDNSSERQRRIELAAKASVDGELVRRLGPHIAAILRREVAPLELMMEDELLYNYYGNTLKSERCASQLAKLMRRVIHKNPRARILEIGAGTGGGTHALLQALGNAESGGPLAESFHFTDISSGFFEAARQKFQAWGDFLTFDKLDIEQDPAAQGFELGSYDIVVSCECLHATKSMARTMANVRSLIKPGGTLLLVETTQDQLDLQFSFGLLPGWWLSEEPERRSSPSLSVPLWDQVLKQAGFTGVDIEIPDSESDVYSISIMMSTATLPQTPKLSPQDIVIVTSGNAHPASWMESLRRAMSAGGILPAVHSLESMATAAPACRGKICVFVGELGQPILYNPDTPEFEALKVLAISCRGLLWVTRGGSVGFEDPQVSLAPGFIRSLRNEYVGRRYLTLDLDPNAERWYDNGASVIAQVLTAGFGNIGNSRADAAPADFEYAERDGILLIPRFYKDLDRNKFISPDVVDFSTASNAHIEPLYQPKRALHMEVATPGLLDTLAFVDDPFVITHGDSLPPEMVEIDPKAYGVNFRDVMVALGQLKQKVMGCECAGIITRVGSRAAAHGYAVGDRVFCMLRGPSFSSRARIEWTGVMHMPAGLSFEHAASIPIIYGTAYYSFVNVTHLQPGQSVLIHAAAGGVGQAAIVIAKHLGAEIFATVGTPEKRELIIQKYGIPEDHIFNSRDTSFAAGVLAATGGRGVDVVLNSLAGPLLQESFNVLAPFGHFVEIGKRDLELNSTLEMHPFSHHVSFTSIDILLLMLERGRIIHRVLAEIARLIEDGVIKPINPITVYPMAEAVDALRLLQAGRHMGKVVLSVGSQEMVKVRPQIPRAKLSSTASYLLVGGVGGIGRSTAYWMVTHGAKNLILMSRSAGNSEKTSAFVAELEDAGCRVKLIGCDVSDPADLSRALRICEEEGLPQVRGVIQGAMVLQDSILEQMTIADYKAAVRPKVDGTWNLHKEFEHADLDFFVMLSSISGLMGLASQSNYSAGGAYEDALARWRVTQGLPAVSIDLGAVKAVGYVAETSSVAARVERIGHRLLDEELVLGALESAILSPYDAQIILGINSGPGHHWDPDGESQVGRDARFQALKYHQNQQGGAGQNGGEAGSGSLGSQLAEVTSREEAVRLIGQAIAQKLSEIFMLPIDDIDLAMPPAQYGVDSLVAVELRNMLAIQAAAEISIFGIMQCASLAALASDVVMKSGHMEASLLVA
ncbi:putative FSP1 [Hypoxylon cercidicola]|nr:putative FSP1 [Hypoxylon cercidicola]